MRVGFQARNAEDEYGNPTGGVVVGTGFTIAWQDGPLGRGAGRQPPNGAFVEDVIAACIQRLEFFQDSAFKCEENDWAVRALKGALEQLDQRTKRREAEGKEGTHTPDN